MTTSMKPAGSPTQALAQLIEEVQIDILVDLNGYSKPPRLGLFALRAAPVQVAWFNMFATSGLREFDYLVGDRHVIPDQEESFYTEQIVRVPGSYLTFEVGYPVPEISPLPCLAAGFLTFGCLAPQYKITTEVIEAWSRILNASPTSRLVLKNVVLEQPAARDFVRGQFARFSIAPDRLDLEGPAEHYTFLERYAGIDVALDTFPYNGGTTTMEALWQGVPVLCFAGDRWASRISASLLREAGLAEFVAPDLEHHIAQAIALARDPETPTPPSSSCARRCATGSEWPRCAMSRRSLATWRMPIARCGRGGASVRRHEPRDRNGTREEERRGMPTDIPSARHEEGDLHKFTFYHIYKCHVCRLRVRGLLRPSSRPEARFQAQPFGRCPRPALIAERTAARHGMAKPLEVAGSQGGVDGPQPVGISHRGLRRGRGRGLFDASRAGSTRTSPRPGRPAPPAPGCARRSAGPRPGGRRPGSGTP